MSNEKAVAIPEDLKAAYQRAKSALEYGQCGDPTRFEKEIRYIELIAALTAEVNALKAQVARLSAPVSMTEIPVGERIGAVQFNRIIAARATPERTK